MKKKNVFAFILALFSSHFAFAQNFPGAISVRLADGYIFFAEKRHLENTSIPTIELGYHFNEKWGMQVGASFINTDAKNITARTGAHGIYYALDGVYHMNAHGYFVPYVLAGVGVTSLKVRNTNDPTNLANINAGIGANYFIADSVALGADARDVYTMSGGNNDIMLTAGITFLFGGSSPQPVYKK